MQLPMLDTKTVIQVNQYFNHISPFLEEYFSRVKKNGFFTFFLKKKYILHLKNLFYNYYVYLSQ